MFSEASKPQHSWRRLWLVVSDLQRLSRADMPNLSRSPGGAAMTKPDVPVLEAIRIMKKVSAGRFTATFQEWGTVTLTEADEGGDEHESGAYQDALTQFAGEIVYLLAFIESQDEKLQMALRAGIMIADKAANRDTGLSATAEDVGREDMCAAIYNFAPAYDQNDNDIPWEKADSHSRQATYDLADALKAEFNITHKPPAAQKE